MSSTFFTGVWGAGLSVAERFEHYHEDNPHVFKKIMEISQELQDRGMNKCSMRLIIERVRWLHAIRTKSDDFKINNNYTPHYARLAMKTDPGLEGFFEIRDSPKTFGKVVP